MIHYVDKDNAIMVPRYIQSAAIRQDSKNTPTRRESFWTPTPSPSYVYHRLFSHHNSPSVFSQTLPSTQALHDAAPLVDTKRHLLFPRQLKSTAMGSAFTASTQRQVPEEMVAQICNVIIWRPEDGLARHTVMAGGVLTTLVACRKGHQHT